MTVDSVVPALLLSITVSLVTTGCQQVLEADSSPIEASQVAST